MRETKYNFERRGMEYNNITCYSDTVRRDETQFEFMLKWELMRKDGGMLGDLALGKLVLWQVCVAWPVIMAVCGVLTRSEKVLRLVPSCIGNYKTSGKKKHIIMR